MSVIFQGIGAGLQFLGSQKEAKAQKEQGRAEKEAAYLEAAQLEQVAKDRRAAATYSASRIREKANQILATQQNNFAATGSNSDGSARAIRAKTIRESSLDQVLLMADAETDAQKDEYTAKVARKTGNTAEALSRRRASATLLGGWGQAASNVGNMAQEASWFT